MTEIQPIQQKRLLVIGCGRSGTKWFSELLKDHGVDIGHEHMGNDGVIGWQWAAPNRWANHGWRLDYRFDHLWHLVRHPLGAIASMTTHHRSTLAWMEGVLGIDIGGAPMPRCARLWVLWNRYCAQQAERTLRIEDVGLLGAEYAELREELKPGADSRFPNYERNSRPHRSLTWQQLEAESPAWAQAVRADAKHYGYGDDE